MTIEAIPVTQSRESLADGNGPDGGVCCVRHNFTGLEPTPSM